ncbi:MAG: ScyD/ScyE family protein [Anaerolineae bacterium]
MKTHRARSVLLFASMFLLLAMALAATVSADGPTMRVVASGLDNPRGLALAQNGRLFVAEAGRGGAGPCVDTPEGRVCFGMSGALTEVDLARNTQRRVITGLPSLADPDGSNAIGPVGVSLLNPSDVAVIVGYGGPPDQRVPAFGPLGGGLGQLMHGAVGRGFRPAGDVSGYEGKANPDGGEVDSDPYAVLRLFGKSIVADAGGNDLLQVQDGQVTTLAVFPDRMVDAPPFLGLPPGAQIPMQAVPTSVVQGPDGAYYVGQLTGFPFPKGGANVYRVPAEGGAPTVYASGFTNIISIAFGADGSLYVLEIAKNGLTSNDPTGALIKVAKDGTRTEIASAGLMSPGGLALGMDGSFYVSNHGTTPGGGTVVHIMP